MESEGGRALWFPTWGVSPAALSSGVQPHRHRLQLEGGLMVTLLSWRHWPCVLKGAGVTVFVQGYPLRWKCVWGVKCRLLPHEDKEDPSERGERCGRGGECPWAMPFALLCLGTAAQCPRPGL